MSRVFPQLFSLQAQCKQMFCRPSNTSRTFCFCLPHPLSSLLAAYAPPTRHSMYHHHVPQACPIMVHCPVVPLLSQSHLVHLQVPLTPIPLPLLFMRAPVHHVSSRSPYTRQMPSFTTYLEYMANFSVLQLAAQLRLCAPRAVAWVVGLADALSGNQILPPLSQRSGRTLVAMRQGPTLALWSYSNVSQSGGSHSGRTWRCGGSVR